MNLIFLNFINSKTSDPHRLILNLKIKQSREEKVNALFYQILIFIIHGKIQKRHITKINYKISAPTWNEEFELLDGSYLIPDIQDYFEYISKKHGENN